MLKKKSSVGQQQKLRIHIEAVQHYSKGLSTANLHRREEGIGQIFHFSTALVALLIGKALHFATVETAQWPTFIGNCPAGFNGCSKELCSTQKKQA